MRNGIGRRTFLAATGAGALGALAPLGAPRGASAQPSDRRFLFVVAALGGGSILDSFAPVAETESSIGTTLTTLPVDRIVQPAGSNLRCVLPVEGELYGLRLGNGYSQADFLMRHGADVVVMQAESTSVNHAVAQRRAMSGDGMDRNRTIAEAVAARWGGELVLPNCNMASAGYGQGGDDPSLDVSAQQVTIADPRFFSTSAHGFRGIADAPAGELVARARRHRTTLDARSPFGRTFGTSPSLARYLQLRSDVERLEAADLISKLMLATELPLEEHGLTPSPLLDRMLSAFPNIARDPFHAQAALAFLLARYGVACSMTISPSNANMLSREGGAQTLINTQLAFDYSHSDHRTAQSIMWSRVLSVIDPLVALLKETDVDGNPELGKMWDKSLVYVASDFGRDKTRGADGAEQFATGHHLNNGVVLVSPLLRGNRVYGRVDPETCLMHGFDRTTGEPAMGEFMSMRDVYSVIAAAMDVDFPGRIDVPAIVR
jgi:hypothetical protein